jgi:hypothetical protein
MNVIASVYTGEMLEARVGIEPTYKGFADLEVAPLTRLFSLSVTNRRCVFCRNFVVLA